MAADAPITPTKETHQAELGQVGLELARLLLRKDQLKVRMEQLDVIIATFDYVGSNPAPVPKTLEELKSEEQERKPKK